MRYSMLLWLRLALARGRRAGPLARAAAAMARPPGPLIWLHLADGPEAASGAALIAQHLLRQRPGSALRVTWSGPEPVVIDWPAGVICLAAPEDTPTATRLVLEAWRPDLIVLVGNDLPSALICSAQDLRIPVMIADARIPPDTRRSMFLRGEQRSLLSRLSRMLVRDPESAAALARLGANPNRIEVGGQLSEPADPLPCSEAERSSIAGQMRARPVWLAVAVPAGELAAVLVAHRHALRHAHRSLLILAPDTPDDATDLACELESDGWVVGRRTLEGEPDEEMQIFLADDPGDFGLWYRLAPVTYMGGTFSEGTRAPRSPLEAAALGSAIVHGPKTAPFGAEYARLDNARAARAVLRPTGLGEAVADLMAPDRAAILAHNAWAVTSGGAGAAEAVARAILSELDSRATGAQ
jgi:3-deoxy-D-manno-octulosonic-acid transferase